MCTINKFTGNKAWKAQTSEIKTMLCYIIVIRWWEKCLFLGKHINKNNMAQWMTDKKIAWKGISVDCTAFAAACPHCTLGERKSEPISKQSFKDVIKNI